MARLYNSEENYTVQLSKDFICPNTLNYPLRRRAILLPHKLLKEKECQQTPCGSYCVRVYVSHCPIELSTETVTVSQCKLQYLVKTWSL